MNGQGQLPLWIQTQEAYGECWLTALNPEPETLLDTHYLLSNCTEQPAITKPYTVDGFVVRRPILRVDANSDLVVRTLARCRSATKQPDV